MVPAEALLDRAHIGRPAPRGGGVGVGIGVGVGVGVGVVVVVVAAAAVVVVVVVLSTTNSRVDFSQSDGFGKAYFTYSPTLPSRRLNDDPTPSYTSSSSSIGWWLRRLRLVLYGARLAGG